MAMATARARRCRACAEDALHDKGQADGAHLGSLMCLTAISAPIISRAPDARGEDGADDGPGAGLARVDCLLAERAGRVEAPQDVHAEEDRHEQRAGTAEGLCPRCDLRCAG